MIKNLSTFFMLSLFFATMSYAKEFLCAEEKELPKERIGCQGEACGFYHYNRALKDIILFERPNEQSRKLGFVKRCEELIELNPIMVIKAFGKARVIRLNEKLAKLGVNLGDKVAIQQYGGEGYLSLCVNKSKDIEAVIEEAGDKNKEIAVVKTLANTNVESWIKLKSKDGLTGYAARSNETIMWYATIDESKLCDPSHKKLLKNF